MSKITIVDLELNLHVGVPDEERAKPQRILMTVDMEHDFRSAIAPNADGFVRCSQYVHPLAAVIGANTVISIRYKTGIGRIGGKGGIKKLREMQILRE